MSAPAPTSSRPLRLELRPSGPLAAGIFSMHLVAAGSFLTVLTGWPGIALAGCMCALGGFVAGDRALLRAAGSPRAIEILADGSAKCLFANGESATLGPGRVTRSWVALPLRAARRRASLLVVAGMLAPDDFRRLRLWARWGRLPNPASDPAALERP